uniref:Uncharacterized protein n=1 Tax=Papio anubis TaxID=9555 RepID=A0A8I5NET0_PAPAN
ITTGLIWGLYFYQHNPPKIPLQIRLLVNPDTAPVAVGPNQVLLEAGKPPVPISEKPQLKAPQSTSPPLISASSEYASSTQDITRRAPDPEIKKKTHTRPKREPISLTLAVMLGIRVTAGVRTGTAALVHGNHHLQQLRVAINEDLRAIEHS